VQPPQGPQRTNTDNLYVVVSDADAHHSRAKKPARKSSGLPWMGIAGGRMIPAAIKKDISIPSASMTLG
jgi:hypothetical protein